MGAGCIKDSIMVAAATPVVFVVGTAAALGGACSTHQPASPTSLFSPLVQVAAVLLLLHLAILILSPLSSLPVSSCDSNDPEGSKDSCGVGRRKGGRDSLPFLLCKRMPLHAFEPMLTRTLLCLQGSMNDKKVRDRMVHETNARHAHVKEQVGRFHKPNAADKRETCACCGDHAHCVGGCLNCAEPPGEDSKGVEPKTEGGDRD